MPTIYNLPRKFKISVTGCRSWCNYPEINDIGFTPVTRRRTRGLETGFSVRVGGGLSTNPHLAVRLNAFVAWNQVVPVARGIAELFRAQDVLRENRERARLKFLFLQHGWTPETFLADLEERIGFKLDPAEPEEVPSDVHRDHVGIHAQKQLGFSYVGANVLSGRITPDQLRLAADLSDRYGDGHIRNTVMQNLVIVNIPDRNAVRVAGELTAAGLPGPRCRLRSRRRRLHRHRILQTRSHRNQGLRSLARRRTRRAHSRLPGAAPHQRHRLPE